MLNIDSLHGKSKSFIESKINFIILQDKDFGKWFDDRFMKYEGMADYNDIEVLNESIIFALNKIFK